MKRRTARVQIPESCSRSQRFRSLLSIFFSFVGPSGSLSAHGNGQLPIHLHVYPKSVFTIFVIYCGVTVSIPSASYGLDGPGIHSRWRQRFLHPSKPTLLLTRLSIQCVKRPGRGVDHLPHLTPRLKKE